MSLYWSCPGCGCEQSYHPNDSRVSVYRCDENLCALYYCDFCLPNSNFVCPCGDGTIREVGIICTRTEWDEQEREEAQEVNLERERKEAIEQQRIYNEMLSKIPPEFVVLFGAEESVCGQVIFENLVYEGCKLYLVDVEEIILPYPCDPIVRYGRGTINMKDGRLLVAKSKRNSLDVKEFNLSGRISIKSSSGNISDIDVKNLIALKRRYPSADEIRLFSEG